MKEKIAASAGKKAAAYVIGALAAGTAAVLGTSERAREEVKDAANNPSEAPAKLVEAAKHGLSDTYSKLKESLSSGDEGLTDEAHSNESDTPHAKKDALGQQVIEAVSMTAHYVSAKTLELKSQLDEKQAHRQESKEQAAAEHLKKITAYVDDNPEASTTSTELEQPHAKESATESGWLDWLWGSNATQDDHSTSNDDAPKP